MIQIQQIPFYILPKRVGEISCVINNYLWLILQFVGLYTIYSVFCTVWIISNSIATLEQCRSCFSRPSLSKTKPNSKSFLDNVSESVCLGFESLFGHMATFFVLILEIKCLLFACVVTSDNPKGRPLTGCQFLSPFLVIILTYYDFNQMW